MGDVSLEFISPGGKPRDMAKCLLSESTVFTYLPVFKIFVKSYEKPQMTKFGPIQNTNSVNFFLSQNNVILLANSI